MPMPFMPSKLSPPSARRLKCPDESVDATPTSFDDQCRRRDRWTKLLSLLATVTSSTEERNESALLTQRNLEEFFNPDYSDEYDAGDEVRRARKVSVSEWLRQLP